MLFPFPVIPSGNGLQMRGEWQVNLKMPIRLARSADEIALVCNSSNRVNGSILNCRVYLMSSPTDLPGKPATSK